MSPNALARKLAKLPVTANLSLIGCALILLASPPAQADEFVQTTVSSAVGQNFCNSSTPPVECASAIPGASASGTASFGAVDGQAMASAGPGQSAEATVDARFTDEFSFLNANGGPTTFTVGFDTTGQSVSGATNSGDFAELQVLMSLQDTSDFHNGVSAEYVLDIEGGVSENSGLPLNLLTLVVPDGHTVNLGLQIFIDAGASNGDSASVTDPTGVFVLSSNPYTSTSGTVYPTSFTSTPEPGSLLLFGSGLAALAAWRRKRSV